MKEVVRRPWAVTHLFPFSLRRGGAESLSPPPPPKRLSAAPAQPRRLAAAARLLHSLLHSRGLKCWNSRKGKGREGAGLGRKSKGGGRRPKTSRSGHDVTSGLFGRGGTGTSLAPAPREPSGGGVTGRRRSPVDEFLAVHLTPRFRILALTARTSFPALGGTDRAS